MNKAVMISALFILGASPFTHESWLEPDHFHYQPDQDIRLSWASGDNFSVETFGEPQQVKFIRAFFDGNSSDVHRQLKSYVIGGAAEGTWMVALQSNPLPRTWEAETVDAYLEENGLEEVSQSRKNANLRGELTGVVTHCTKLILQSGDKAGDAFREVAGFPLEIIPTGNPSVLKPGDRVDCELKFKGKPLSHTLVKIWSRLNRTTFLQNLYTENDGTVKFPISTSGSWMVSVVKMVKGEKGWECFQSSMVFGVK
jgi:uncharacterized GH25 family protein